MSRPIAREVAMKRVYAEMLGGDATPDAILEQSEITEPLEADEVDFVGAVVAGVAAHAEELDALVDRYAVDWAVDRIARVDLAILRVSAYELLYRSDVPTGASINEAVELSKRFGGERSFAFVNGILGSIARSLPQGEDGAQG